MERGDDEQRAPNPEGKYKEPAAQGRCEYGEETSTDEIEWVREGGRAREREGESAHRRFLMSRLINVPEHVFMFVYRGAGIQ